MLVLVTGASGRIGSHLTRALIREGHRVRALAVPHDPRVSAITGPDVEVVYGRLENAEVLVEAVRGIDAVYHLAGALTSRDNSDEEFFEFNLRGTFNLLMAIRAHAPNIRRFAYASSDAVYYSGPKAAARYLPIDESHPRLSGSVYGASKIGAEELCLTFWRGFGIPVTIFRFGATADAAELIDPHSVYARWLFLNEAIGFLSSRPDPSAEQLEALKILKGCDDDREQLVIMADQDGVPEVRGWGDARDVAEGCVRALEIEAATGEVFNLGGLSPFSTDELVKYIGAKLDLPYIIARLANTRKPWYLSNAKAEEILGYAPRYSVFDMVDEAIAKSAD